MRRQDAQVRLRPSRGDPACSSDAVADRPQRRPRGGRQLVAEDLGLPIVGEGEPDPLPRIRDRFSWPEHLRQALLMLVHGHASLSRCIGSTRAATGRICASSRRGRRRTIEEVEGRRRRWADLDQAVRRRGGGIPSASPIPVNRLRRLHPRQRGRQLAGRVAAPPGLQALADQGPVVAGPGADDRAQRDGDPALHGPEDPAADELTATGSGMATSWRAGEAAGSAIPFSATLKLRGVEGTLPDAQPAIDVPRRARSPAPYWPTS